MQTPNTTNDVGTTTPATNTTAREPSNVPGLNSILQTLPRDATEAEIKAAIGKRIDAMRAHAEKHGYRVIKFSTPGTDYSAPTGGQPWDGGAA